MRHPFPHLPLTLDLSAPDVLLHPDAPWVSLQDASSGEARRWPDPELLAALQGPPTFESLALSVLSLHLPVAPEHETADPVPQTDPQLAFWAQEAGRIETLLARRMTPYDDLPVVPGGLFGEVAFSAVAWTLRLDFSEALKLRFLDVRSGDRVLSAVRVRSWIVEQLTRPD